MSYLLLQGDARRIPLADQSVHCVVTSPPYFGLRDYGAEGQIGLESTPDAFVATMVGVFREVWRVLRNDGTLWLNLGDSYNAYNGGAGPSSSLSRGAQTTERPALESGYGLKVKGLKPKDLIGIPWRVALALQADGWTLRSDIVWSKPNPMPESVSDRPTKSHEYIFLLTKSDRYFYDADAIRETDGGKPSGNDFKNRMGAASYRPEGKGGGIGSDNWFPGGGRNKRSVWNVSVNGFAGAHFATFPTKLIEPCVKAGTSHKGCCPACGSPWRRVTEKDRVATRSGATSKVYADPENSPYEQHSGTIVGNRDPFRHCTTTKTVGWEPGCQCDRGDPVPCVVLDPFNGAATTGVVSLAEGRRYVGIDLNPDYLAISRRRLARPHAPTVKRPAKSKSNRTPDLFGAFQK